VSDWLAGELLVILLKHREMTQAELAAQIGRPAQMISEIATGKKRVTAETAVQFEDAFGLPARIWLSLQDEADLRRVRRFQMIADTSVPVEEEEDLAAALERLQQIRARIARVRREAGLSEKEAND
jgi:addiction module HigA family antidote